MKLFFRILLLIFIVTATAGFKSDVTLLPRYESYTDPDTGAVMPPEIDSYQKTQVTKNLNPVYGTVVRYSNKYGSCADVYIYSLDTKASPVNRKTADAHYSEVKKSILNLPNAGGPVSSVSANGEKNISESGLIAIYCAFTISIGEETLFSDLVMFPFKGKVIKIRISYPTDLPEEKESAEHFVKTVLEIFSEADFVDFIEKEKITVSPAQGEQKPIDEHNH